MIEFHVLNIHPISNPQRNLEETLNELGKKGWSLTLFIPLTCSLVFSRIVPKEKK